MFVQVITQDGASQGDATKAGKNKFSGSSEKSKQKTTKNYRRGPSYNLI